MQLKEYLRFNSFSSLPWIGGCVVIGNAGVDVTATAEEEGVGTSDDPGVTKDKM